LAGPKREGGPSWEKDPTQGKGSAPDTFSAYRVRLSDPRGEKFLKNSLGEDCFSSGI